MIATGLGMLSWRPRTEDDAGLLRALFASSRQGELDMLGGDPEQQRGFVDIQLRAREHHRDATRPGAALGIVTLDDVAIGQIDLHRTDDAVEVLEIALVPGLRGHGLGEAILRRVLADAGDLPVRLHVEPANPARRLYERMGFAATGTEGMHIAMERSGAGAAPVGATAPSTDDPAVPADGSVAAAREPVVGLAPMPTYEDLAPRIGATVPVLPDGPDLELVEVAARPQRGPSGRVPFSALLTGPPDRPLDQGIHRLDLPGPGPFDVFIVPMVPVGGKAAYELVVA